MGEKHLMEDSTDWPTAPQPLVGTVIDSHTHLDVHDNSLHGENPPDPGQLLEWAREVGVDRVVQVGCDVASSRWAVDAANLYPAVIASVALHPNEAPRLAEKGELTSSLAQISELAQSPRVRGIGETGLDYFRTGENGRPAQHESFRFHIDLAKQL
ncbi:MAG: TatD family hydrolase, partial [Candidatus Nanopelagicales bacterium]|nr:TatD family hydrolase [Candidatus Nanopelagicales bacterium]